MRLRFWEQTGLTTAVCAADDEMLEPEIPISPDPWKQRSSWLLISVKPTSNVGWQIPHRSNLQNVKA